MRHALHLTMTAILLIGLAACEQPTQVVGIERPDGVRPPLHLDALSAQAAVPTGDVATSDLLITQHLPATLRVNAPFEYELTVTNLTDAPLQQIAILQELPDFVALHGGERLDRLAEPDLAQTAPDTPPADPPAADDRFIVYSPFDQPLLPQEMVFGIPRGDYEVQPISGGEWRIARLDPGESRTLRIAGVAADIGTVQTHTRIGDEPIITLTTEAIDPELRLERWAPQQIIACEPIPVHYRLTNVGSGTAPRVVLTEMLPEGQFHGEREREILIEAGDLAQGEHVEFRVDTFVNEPGTYESRAIVTDGFGESFRSRRVTTAARAPQLELELDLPERAYVEQNVPGIVRITNTGDAAAEDLRVRQTVPTDARARQISHDGRIIDDAINWVLPPLQPEQSVELRLELAMLQPGAMRTMATAEAFCADEQTATATVELEGIATLRVELMDHHDPVPIGQSERYTITVTNRGNAADRDVRIVATVPEQMQLLETIGPIEPEVDQQQVRFTIDALRPRETVRMEVIAEALEPGDVRFEVQVDSEGLTQPVTLNEATRLF